VVSGYPFMHEFSTLAVMIQERQAKDSFKFNAKVGLEAKKRQMCRVSAVALRFPAWPSELVAAGIRIGPCHQHRPLLEQFM